MATIVLYTEGTLGDHLPWIALGQALLARGHRVRLVMNPAMHPYAHRVGLEAMALTDIVRGSEHARMHAWAWNDWHTPAPETQQRPEPFDLEQYVTQARELIALCRDADLLIATAIRTLGNIRHLAVQTLGYVAQRAVRTLGYVAQRAVGLPWLTVSLNPAAFWQPLALQEHNALRQRQIDEYGGLRDLIAYAFSRLELPQIPPPWSHGGLYAPTVLLASSPHLSQPDLHQLQPHSRLTLTGFWWYDDPAWHTWQPEDTLRQFCQRQPIVLAFSSQPLEDLRRVLTLHVEAAARLHRPLLVQRGWAGFSEADLPPGANPQEVMVVDDLPHDWLFAQAACAIQHGGLGSMARALRHGCPLLIEPYDNDQLYNASRVVDLGVGAAMHPFKMTVDGLVQVLQAKVLTPEYRQRAAALGDKMRAEDGLETACQLIDASLTHRQDAPHSTRPRLRPAGRGHQALAVAPSSSSTIPHLLHQTWKDTALPPNLRIFQHTWRVHHPDWMYELWTDADNRAFLACHYPWFVPIYDRYPYKIMRVDVVRYFLLYHYGGVYADLDFECLRPLEPLLAEKHIVLGVEPAQHYAYHFPHTRPVSQLVCNAFMASVPHHPFWEHVFQHLVTYQHATDPLHATGPFLLSRAYDSYPQPEAISVEPAPLLYPLTAAESQQRLLDDPAVRTKITQTAYAVHHWYCTWWQETVAQRAEQVGVHVGATGQPAETTTLRQMEQP